MRIRWRRTRFGGARTNEQHFSAKCQMGTEPASTICPMGLLCEGHRSRAVCIRDWSLAQTLFEQGDWSAAAVEYRRLALMEEEPARRTGWRWMAAYAYHRGRHADLAEALLDRVEAECASGLMPALLLRAEIARVDRRPAEAAFYFESVAASATDDSACEYARRAALAARIEARDLVGARAVLTEWPNPSPQAVEALSLIHI